MPRAHTITLHALIPVGKNPNGKRILLLQKAQFSERLSGLVVPKTDKGMGQNEAFIHFRLDGRNGCITVENVIGARGEPSRLTYDEVRAVMLTLTDSDLINAAEQWAIATAAQETARDAITISDSAS